MIDEFLALQPDNLRSLKPFIPPSITPGHFSLKQQEQRKKDAVAADLMKARRIQQQADNKWRANQLLYGSGIPSPPRAASSRYVPIHRSPKSLPGPKTSISPLPYPRPSGTNNAAIIVSASTSSPVTQSATTALAASSSCISVNASTTELQSSNAAVIAGDEQMQHSNLLQWIQTNRNQNTASSYQSRWNSFQKYLVSQGSPGAANSNLITAIEIAAYLRKRLEVDQVSAATLSGDRNGIASVLKYTTASQAAYDALVTEVLRVCQNRAPQSSPKRHLTTELVRTIMQVLQLSGGVAIGTSNYNNSSAAAAAPNPAMLSSQNWIAQRNACMILFMFVGMLRESEATALLVSDVQVKLVPGPVPADAPAAAASSSFPSAQSVLSVTISKSKTDQRGVGATRLFAANPGDSLLCPVKAFQLWMSIRESMEFLCPYLFPTDKDTQMDSSTPCGIIQRAVQSANQLIANTINEQDRFGSPSEYGSHSCRRGGVTAARDGGAGMHEIQSQGRWSKKSNTVYGYIGETDRDQLSVSEAIFRASAASTSSTAVHSNQPLRIPTSQAVSAAASQSSSYNHSSVPRSNHIVPPMYTGGKPVCIPGVWTLSDYDTRTDLDRIAKKAKREGLGLPILSRQQLVAEKEVMKREMGLQSDIDDKTLQEYAQGSSMDHIIPFAKMLVGAGSSPVVPVHSLKSESESGAHRESSKRFKSDASSSIIPSAVSKSNKDSEEEPVPMSEQDEEALLEAMQMEEWNQRSSDSDSDSDSHTSRYTDGVSSRTRSRSSTTAPASFSASSITTAQSIKKRRRHDP